MIEPSNQGGGDTKSHGQVYFGLPGVFVSSGAHIAHFFTEPMGRWSVLARFIRAGIETGDQCLLVTEPSAFPLITKRLGELGIEDLAMGSNQLILSEGSARVGELASTIRGAVARAKIAGRQAIRVGADMTWSIGKSSVAENLMKLEAIYHRHVARRTDFVALCQYDVSRFDGATIMGAIQTHPLAIIGNTVENNTFFRDPRAILRELSRQTTGLRRT